MALGLDQNQSGMVLARTIRADGCYTLLAGLLGVVLTDFLQFGLALLASILLAVFASLISADWPRSSTKSAERARPSPSFQALPTAEVFWAFIAYVGVKSWSSGNRRERLHRTTHPRHTQRTRRPPRFTFGTRSPISPSTVALDQSSDSSPWFASPASKIPKAGYVMVLLDVLPSGVRGMLIAAMLAAFMSTIDTQLNWGASYLTHDVY